MKKIPKRFRTQDKVCKKFQLLGVSRRKQKATNLECLKNLGHYKNPDLDIPSFIQIFHARM